MIPTSIGQYKIIKQIGDGGMATVYEAEDTILFRRVAIKVLHAKYCLDTDISRRFREEARFIAKIQHPNIVQIFQFIDEPMQLAIVMELLTGADLKKEVQSRGGLPNREIPIIFSQIISAITYIHEQGLVHRDIKPSNIFICKNGTVKILDFGIAKEFGTGMDRTGTGIQIGTPMYMSPEQVHADKSIDYRSDIYSLGVTLYFMVSGKTPYDEASTPRYVIETKIVQEALPALHDNPRMNEIIQRATRKNREERFQSCLEFQQCIISVEKATHSTGVDTTIVDGTGFGKNTEGKATQSTGGDKTIVFGTVVGKNTKGKATQNTDSDKTIVESQNEVKIIAPPSTKKKNEGVLIGVVVGFFILIILYIILVEKSRTPDSETEVVDARIQDSARYYDSLLELIYYDSLAAAERGSISATSIDIGSQTWMTKNLNVDHFRNGDPIPEAKTYDEWKSAGEKKQPAWCYYDNDPKNGTKYGKLYNWYAVNDWRGLAPKGYHIPSDIDWKQLTNYLGGENVAGEKMKSTLGWKGKGNGSNSSRFTSLPCGGRDSDGPFGSIGEYGYWWSSTMRDRDNALFCYLYYSSSIVTRYYYNKQKGLSVRCLRD